MRYMLTMNDAQAVVDTLGGEMISYKVGDVDYGWGGDPAYWKGRAPILFPVVCALKEGHVRFGGEEYHIEKHGFANKMEFNAVAVEGSQIELTLRFSEESLKKYPYPFGLMVIHTLLEDGFSTTYLVKNKGDRPMHFCIGGHPGFCVPMGGEGSFEDYQLVFEKTENIRSRKVNQDGLIVKEYADKGALLNTDTLPLRYSDFDDDALIYDGLKSRCVRLVHRETGKGIAFHFDGFPVLGIWTPVKKEAPFLCLEPWHGCPAYVDETGDFEDKPHAITLEPGDIHRSEYRVQIL